MSVFVSLNYPGSVNLLTDGASWDEKGNLSRLGRKVAWSEEVPLAVTTRGNVGMGDKAKEMIVDHVEDVGFDAAMVDIADGLRRLVPQPENNGRDHLEVLIAGLSESRGVIHLTFHNTAYSSGAGYPLKLYDPGHACLRGTPANAADLMRSGVQVMSPNEDPAVWCERNGAALFNMFRKVPALQFDAGRTAGQLYGLGGQCDLTTVTAEGVKVQTLCRWPEDRIGRPINPFAGQNVSPIGVGMNRQQRRQAERDARKGVAA